MVLSYQTWAWSYHVIPYQILAWSYLIRPEHDLIISDLNIILSYQIWAWSKSYNLSMILSYHLSMILSYQTYAYFYHICPRVILKKKRALLQSDLVRVVELDIFPHGDGANKEVCLLRRLWDKRTPFHKSRLLVPGLKDLHQRWCWGCYKEHKFLREKEQLQEQRINRYPGTETQRKCLERN